MALQRVKLALTTSIIIGDARRLEEGKKPLRTIWGLAQELERINPELYEANKTSNKLRRLERTGQERIDRYLIADLTHVLHVTYDELHDVDLGTVNH